jgi:hypothetical protein
MTLLIIAAVFNFIIAVGHLSCLFSLDFVFRLYGIDGTMSEIASYGQALPYILTVVIALLFTLAGLYALAAAGKLKIKLPLVRLAIWVIAAVFFSRALVGIAWLIAGFTTIELTSTLISGIVGTLYLIGGLRTMKNRPRHCQ